MLIASRALLGVAGATIAPSTLSLIFVMFEEPRQRSTAVGIWVSAFSAGGVIGPILGGILLEQFWWGSVFLLAVPVMAVLLLVGPRVLPEYRDPSAGRLDLVSVALSLVAILALIFGLKTVAQDGIGLVPVASLAIGLVVGAVWVRRQLTAADPMFDLRLFRIARFTTAARHQLPRDLPGRRLLPVRRAVHAARPRPHAARGCPVVAARGDRVHHRPEHRAADRAPCPSCVPPVRRIAVAGVGLAILGSITASSPNGLALVVIASTIISIGLGPVFGLTTELIVGSAPPERAGAATGMSETWLGGRRRARPLAPRDHRPRDLPLPDRRRIFPPACRMPLRRPRATRSAPRSRSRHRSRPRLASRSPAIAQDAFVDGMQVVAAVGVVVAIAVAAFTFMTLRHIPPTEDVDAATTTPEPRRVPQATWYCG